MIILNTTFYIHESIDEFFHQWLDQEYLPSAISNGLSEPVVSRLLIEPQEGMTGYAVQLSSEEMAGAQSWHDDAAAMLRGKMSGRFGEKMLFFTTYMERLR